MTLSQETRSYVVPRAAYWGGEILPPPDAATLHDMRTGKMNCPRVDRDGETGELDVSDDDIVANAFAQHPRRLSGDL